MKFPVYLSVILASLVFAGPVFAGNGSHWAMGGSIWADHASTYKAKPKKYKSKASKKYSKNKGIKKKTAKRSKKSKRKNKVRLGGGGKPRIAAGKPRVVKFRGKYKKGSIVIDTARRKLYYVLGNKKAYRYPVAVGKKGFAWTGTQRISRKVSWPDWRPPKEMRQRKPHLPKLVKGGVNNPLGAKALYLGKTLYRIHGTNNLKSIGRAASSGCFRMRNSHVVHLSRIAPVGTRVHVVRRLSKKVVSGGKKG